MSKSENANDLEILAPDREITLTTGEKVTVREYGFMEGLRIQNLAAGLLEDLTRLFLDEPEKAQDLAVLEEVFSRHSYVIADLMALSAGKDREWVEGLNDTDGQVLMMSWWSVNTGFFVRRLVAAAATRQGSVMAANAQQGGEGSLPH